MTHMCSTGYHQSPSRSCYINHACRCSWCTWHEAAYYAQRQDQPAPPKPGHRTVVEVPTGPWAAITGSLRRSGHTVDEWLTATAKAMR